jgi:type II secretory pathway component GspD/PulD (secretin)
VAVVTFAFKHARAAAVTDLLQRLFPARAVPVSQPSPSQTQPGSGAPPRTAVAADPAPRIWYDEATNQVIAIAGEEDFAMMKEIVARVDVEPAK